MQQIQSRPGHNPIKAKPIRIECFLGNPWIKETVLFSVTILHKILPHESISITI
uniref:Uncharacterized protein n=1 Tax=Solanum tuberosum TaxID=4113 RepID=M1CEU3_SOLTU